MACFSLPLRRRGASFIYDPPPSSSQHHLHRCFRSSAALDALRSHIGAAAEVSTKPRSLALYNYPSFSGAFAALFSHLYHSRLRLPLLSLPFSSVEPFRIEDFKPEGIETCYLLDFIGPKDFAVELSRIVPRVIAFDHRESTAVRISRLGGWPENLELRVYTKMSSARAVYDYFSDKLTEKDHGLEKVEGLLSHECGDRILQVLRYIEDADLRQWKLPDIKAFGIGLKEEWPKLNSVTNSHLFEQLLQIDANDLIFKGNSYISSRQDAANKLLEKPFKIHLGRGLYGECLAIRADGSSNLSHEIGVELSKRSATAGLRPIGAVVFMQKNGNLKMCLRSTDNATDTSEIAKAYGGGGNANSSSFIIRMDEYGQWRSSNVL